MGAGKIILHDRFTTMHFVTGTFHLHYSKASYYRGVSRLVQRTNKVLSDNEKLENTCSKKDPTAISETLSGISDPAAEGK